MSTRLGPLLRDSGHDCVHVEDRDLLGAQDEAVMAAAAAESRVLVSMDTDFGELLASGRSAVEIVERVVHIPPHTTAPTHRTTPTHGEWVPLLRELADQLDGGRIYARDLPDLAAALTDVLAAYDRHPKTRAQRH